MGRVTENSWPFDVPPENVVVTSTYVTRDGMPVLHVSHSLDEEGEVTWQFHCGNGDFSARVMQLVRLEEVIRLDSSLVEVAGLPLETEATRDGVGAPWVTRAENKG
jgi:hypothetical protein